MIIWLASYPRSGNTLLRTVLKHTMGVGSYSDEMPIVKLTEVACKGIGHIPMTEAWESFYEKAMIHEDTYFVKTHLPPRDKQPAIYVVRDGRLAMSSYAKFHRQHQPEHGRSLLELVMGCDFYGDWSEHYRAWTDGKGRKSLVVKYEDLVNASGALLARIAAFVGSPRSPQAWENPFEQMKKANPDFFVAGRLEWDGDEAWSPFIDGVFFDNHGVLMEELGYVSCAEISIARSRLTPNELALAGLAKALTKERRKLERVCQERQTVINELERACEQRLALIERLTAG